MSWHTCIFHAVTVNYVLVLILSARNIEYRLGRQGLLGDKQTDPQQSECTMVQSTQYDSIQVIFSFYWLHFLLHALKFVND